MVIWLIGVLFTWGFIADEKPGVWVILGIVFVWPMLLGMAIKEWYEKSKPPNKEEG